MIQHLNYLSIDPRQRQHMAAKAKAALNAVRPLTAEQAQALAQEHRRLDQWAAGQLPAPEPPKVENPSLARVPVVHSVVVADTVPVTDTMR